jgi:ABC-2 type transport system ATP-binding protein
MIRVEALTRTYDGLTVVDQVSFEIGTGEIVGLLGHNGEGTHSSNKNNGKSEIL